MPRPPAWALVPCLALLAIGSSGCAPPAASPAAGAAARAGDGAAGQALLATPPPLPPGAVRQQTLDGLERLFDKALPYEDELLLFDERLRVRFDRDDRSLDGTTVTSGQFVTREGFLTLTRRGRSISGSGWLEGSGMLTLSALSDGVTLVVQGPATFETACLRGHLATGPDTALRCAAQPGAAPEAVVDVAAMYTEAAMCALSRCDDAAARQYAECQMRTAIADWITQANDVMIHSQVGVTWRLVGLELLPYVEQDDDLDALLKRLKNRSQDPGKALGELRERTAADVALVVVDKGNADGLAQPLALTPAGEADGDHPIAIVTRKAGAGKMMAAHELPHLLGAGHTDGAYGICPFSKAWLKQVGSFRVRTVMDISSASPRPFLSTPERRFQYPETMGAADAIDNTRTLRIFRAEAAGWRSAPTPSPTIVLTKCPDWRPAFALTPGASAAGAAR